MEGVTKLSTGNLISLSEQEVVDCDVQGDDHGCNGGWPTGAFKFIIQNGGLTTERSYPYTATQGTCNIQKATSRAAQISGYEDVPANNEAALLMAVANQPVSLAIDGGGSAFQFYSNGVFAGPCGFELDHAITAVGYGQDSDGTKYWLIKNSWGESWGENGYIRMERDVEYDQGLCGFELDHAITAVGYGQDSDGTKYWLIKNSWGESWGENGYIRMERDVEYDQGLCGIAMQVSYPTA